MPPSIRSTRNYFMEIYGIKYLLLMLLCYFFGIRLLNCHYAFNASRAIELIFFDYKISVLYRIKLIAQWIAASR